MAGAVAVEGFNGVLGSRRGSVTAQAQRDASERRTREDVLRDFCLAVESPRVVNVVGAAGELATELIDAYERGDSAPSSPNYAKLVDFLRRRVSEDGPLGLIAAIKYGDPAGFPGLTTPAISGLATYLRTNAPRSGRKYHLPNAIGVVSQLLQGRHPRAHYEKLASVCEAIGELITTVSKNPSKNPEAGPMLCEAAAAVLCNAPVEALLGPLSSWPQAFTERARRELCDYEERRCLCILIAKVFAHPQLEELMRPLNEALVLTNPTRS
jgi:hypothetical protein